MTTAGLNVPVVFLVFRRPELTARVLARIREARPSRLFVVADGPRRGRAEDAAGCAEVRRVIERGVDWPCELTRDYAPENRGCAARVSSGITAAFAAADEAIILEDDCLPDASFFPFCAELLARHRDDERVAQVAGCCFLAPPAGPESYFFSRYPHCWGWATWRRAWRHYDHDLAAWRDPATRARVLGAIEDPRERAYWQDAFDRTAAGRTDSWAYRWTLSCWARGAWSANATANLVTNVGFGAQATHTAGDSPGAALPVAPLSFPLHHPPRVERDAARDAGVGRRCFQPRGWAGRIRSRVRRLLT